MKRPAPIKNILFLPTAARNSKSNNPPEAVKKGRLTYPILDRGRLNRSLILSIVEILLNLVILFYRRCIQRLNCFRRVSVRKNSL